MSAEDTYLGQHARRELILSGQYEEDPEISECIIKAINAFSTYGHSGGSHYAAMAILERLLDFKNLSPLTDNPDEWIEVGDKLIGEPVWQNARNGEAFSYDEGKTYYLLSERKFKSWKNLWLINEKPIHHSKPFNA